MATEINNHPELPGVQKYGSFSPSSMKKSMPDCREKSTKFYEGRSKREGGMRVRGRGQKNRRKRLWDSFRPDEREREREIPYTLLKVAHVCILDVWISQKHPQFVKGDPSVPLTSSKFVLDKQNKHIAIDHITFLHTSWFTSSPLPSPPRLKEKN